MAVRYVSSKVSRVNTFFWDLIKILSISVEEVLINLIGSYNNLVRILGRSYSSW